MQRLGQRTGGAHHEIDLAGVPGLGGDGEGRFAQPEDGDFEKCPRGKIERFGQTEAKEPVLVGELLDEDDLGQLRPVLYARLILDHLGALVAEQAVEHVDRTDARQALAAAAPAADAGGALVLVPEVLVLAEEPG